jgi:hypothetical protein
VLLLSATFFENLSRSWLKWGDVLIDTGRDLDVARQVSEGRALYSELRYTYGPLTPWLNAAAFKLFGIHTFVFVAFGAACAILTSIWVYRISRLFLPRLPSVTITVAFQYICAFGSLTPTANFNFILPYTPAATYGTVLCLGSVYFLLRYVLRGMKAADLAVSLALLFLTALDKVELLAAACVAHFVAQACLLGTRRATVARTAGVYAIPIALASVVYGALYLQVGAPLFADNLFTHLNPSFKDYSLEHMGLLDVGASLWAVLFSLAAAAIVAGVAALAARLQNHLSRAATHASEARRSDVLLGCLCAAVAILVYGWLPIEYTFRIFLLAAMTASGALFTAGLRTGFTEHRSAQLTFWLFSLACTMRILLKTAMFFYGFYLLIPGLICFGLLWFCYLPRLVCWPGWGLKLCSVGVFIGVIAAHVDIANFLNSWREHRIHTPFADLKVLTIFRGVAEGRCQSEAIRLLSTLPKESRVLAIPVGLGLTFCAGLENPYRSGEYTAIEMNGRYSDIALLRRLQANEPDLIVRTRDVGNEFGVFGLDYAQQTWAWIVANYEPCALIGQHDYMVIFKRKGAPYPFPDPPMDASASRAPAH